MQKDYLNRSKSEHFKTTLSRHKLSTMQGITLLSMFLGCVSALPVYRAPLNMRGGNSGKNRRPNVNGGMGNGAGGTGWNGAIIPGGGGGTAGVFIGQSSSSYNGQGNGGAGGGGNGAGGGEGGINTDVSSSESDYDSTPSYGGGDTNPFAPTLPPGGDPTTPNAAHPLQAQAGGFQAAGIFLALGLVVGVCVGVAVYIIKKKG